MTAFYAPDPINSTQFIPGGNTPASGALLFCYQVGSSTKQNTYTDQTASTARTNPIVLDSGGNIPGNGEVWIASTSKFVLAPFNDTDPPVSPYWSRDNLPGVNDPSQLGGEWIASGLVPTFVNGSTFIFSGDQTGTFTTGRRIRTINTAGTFYSTIATSAFSASTTIGIASDTIGIDSGLSTVSYGILNPKNTSLPLIVSVLNFGAKGDGVTDDTAALTAAVAAIQISGATLVFPAGTYLYSTSPNFASNGAKYLALGTVILKHTGTGNACIFDAGTTNSIFACRLEGDFQINGNSNSTNGLYIRAVHHSFFQVRILGCATTGAGIQHEFGVCNTFFMPRISSNEGFNLIPAIGIHLTRRLSNSEPVSYCTFIDPIVEGVTTGIKCEFADGNVFLGGTSEGCSVRGLEESSNCHANHFIKMDFEVNTTDDVNCAGVCTTFENCDSNTLVVLTGTNQVLRGGQYNSISLNATGATVSDVRYNRNGTGTYTDVSLSQTTKRSVFNVATAMDADRFPVSVTIPAGGLQIGAPTGGDKGIGTANATAYYLNNSLLLGAKDTSISTGVGVIHMKSANPATNAAWVPITSADGTVYFVPGWTTNSP